MFSSKMFTSTTSRTLNVMAKFCPEPTKGDSCSAIPFICASLAECILLVILRVILVSVESGIEYERMPSYASPDFVVMVTEVPWQKKVSKGAQPELSATHNSCGKNKQKAI